MTSFRNGALSPAAYSADVMMIDLEKMNKLFEAALNAPDPAPPDMQRPGISDHHPQTRKLQRQSGEDTRPTVLTRFIRPA